MTTSQLKKITSNFREIKPLINAQNDLVKQSNRIRRRLKTKLQNYKFLQNLVGVNASGSQLVNSVISLFKNLGFEKIENVDQKYRDEDIRLWHDDMLFIIEITGVDTPQPTDNKAHQISKHIPIRQMQYPDYKVVGLFIVNHNNKKEYSKREKKPFSERLINIAEYHKYTLITTVDLLKAFVRINNNHLKVLDFIQALCKTGEFKI